MFEHLHTLLIDIWTHSHSVIPVQVGVKFWNIGVWLSTNENNIVVSMVEVRLQPPPDCIPHSYCMKQKVFEHFDMLWIGIWAHTLMLY